MSKKMRFLIPVLLAMMLGIAYAAPGDLDTTFGTNGVATYDSGNDDQGWIAILQPDGKIVVSGVTFNGTDGDVLVLRYNSDGTLDTTFGTNGVATYDSGNADQGWIAILQPDGKIVVPGVTFNGTDGDVLVLRYNSDGTLDTTFGTNGVATYDSGNDDHVWWTTILQPDGKIVVPGFTFNGTDSDVLVLRYNSDGTLDTTFGTNGVATYDSGNGDGGFKAILQPDGKIVVLGLTFNGTDSDVLVLRYNSDGTLDTTFGTNGVATYDSGNDDGGRKAILQPDGKIVVPGVTFNGTDSDVLVLRYNSDGTLDTTFGTNGVATYDSGNDDEGWEAILQPDGKIVVPGLTFNGTDSDVLVLRYNSDGTLDTTFGTNGVATYDSGNDDQGWIAILQPDGKIVASGVTFNGTDYDLLVVRLIGHAVWSGGRSGGGGCSMSNPEGQINIGHQLILVGIFALGLLVWRERRRRLSTYGR